MAMSLQPQRNNLFASLWAKISAPVVESKTFQISKVQKLGCEKLESCSYEEKYD